MGRLIDADALCKLANNSINKSVDANDIMRFPTVDAVPVVRCKDCKFFCEQYFSMNCSYHVSAVCENWFCSQGRVKE